MELQQVDKLFHAVRVFNYENFLYAYVELFNTFQSYVLLSTKYDFVKRGNIDKSYGNIIEMNTSLDENLLESVTPKNYKDVDIIRKQYQIDIKKMIEDLEKYHDYNSLDKSKQVNMLFMCIGKKVYEQIRKQSYIKDYQELLNQHYHAINFSNVNLFKKDKKIMNKFCQDYQFYTIYDNDCINFETYKKIHPQNIAYPIAICNILNSNWRVEDYGKMKFYMLENRMNKM